MWDIYNCVAILPVLLADAATANQFGVKQHKPWNHILSSS
jgi:hypothetical protein